MLEHEAISSTFEKTNSQLVSTTHVDECDKRDCLRSGIYKICVCSPLT